MPVGERTQELVREGLAGRPANRQTWVVRAHERGDRAQQMRLADARRTADKERVVCLCGHLGDRQGGSVGEPVAVADDELLERELGVAEQISVLG